MTSYGFRLFDDAEELDFVGPWEVITASSTLRVRDGADPDDGDDRRDRQPGEVRQGHGGPPHHSIDDHPPLDVIVVPGGQGTRAEIDNETLLAWLGNTGPLATWVTSVCTGSLLLVGAGLATNKRVATHWSFEDTLAERGDCTVVRDARWVRDGNVVTSQGVSAGIDMALWLIGQIHNPAHARAVQRYIAYEPAPPYQADV
ncbi:MAG: DJ-1/PfpI family protein [Candidatus Microthrix sp.]|nr:DJ-1/PfpI family protein [Candidatus Microthrix sp.]